MLMGIGGTPEGVISAAAIKCLGGAIQGRLWPRNDDERARARSTPASTSTACSPRTISSRATTSSSPRPASPAASLLRGVRASATGVETESIVMRSRSGTVRRIAAYHPSDKLTNLRKEALMAVAGAERDRTGDRRGQQGNPRRGRVDGHDQEALRRDRGRVDGGDTPGLPEPAVHDARDGGVHRRRDPLRRDDPPERGRRHAVSELLASKGSSPGSRSTSARSRSRLAPGEIVTDGLDGLRERLRRVRRARRALREVARGDHDRRPASRPTRCIARERACARPLRRALPGGRSRPDRRARGADGCRQHDRGLRRRHGTDAAGASTPRSYAVRRRTFAGRC